MNLPFCKIYETNGGERMIGFPLKETEKGDHLQYWTLPVPSDVDLALLARLINKAAEDWFYKREEEDND